ncbi:FAD-binding domain protein [Ceratobasidium sp. AG-Ba]|nr:FAD-binding domain protein [Ceratobasidium sp. AG-Ba]
MRHLATLVAASFISAGVFSRELCTASQKCWPSPDVWSQFNASVGGRLVAPHPPAWPCHDPHYDEAACQQVKSNWINGFWRANQTGAMQDPVWDSFRCSIDAPRNEPCDQGFVPVYAVAAEDSDDISKAVVFAGKHKLRLIVKNTGHDYLGRSSAAGSFGIWTHKLKGMDFNDAFVPTGCAKTTPGMPAVTLGAGEQWRDVHKAADERNLTIVGGAARSVGSSGGWVQGGGHSPLGLLYGMGVDNVLQFRIVKPDGKLVIANACQNKDLFWALRGGGGGTWGVALDATFKTHPALDSMVGVYIVVNVTSPGKLTSLAEDFLRAVPDLNARGVSGYAVWAAQVTATFTMFHQNSSSVEHTNQTLAPIWNWIANNTDTKVSSYGKYHPTFYDFFETWVSTDPLIGTPIWVTGRLVSAKAMKSRPAELAKLVLVDSSPSMNLVAGGAVNQVDPDSTGLNPQWRNDAIMSWNFGGSWNSTTPTKTIEEIKKRARDVTLALGDIAGLDHAAYFNEANPEEPMWKKAFFGDHYDRLLKIKRKIDPKCIILSSVGVRKLKGGGWLFSRPRKKKTWKA